MASHQLSSLRLWCRHALQAKSDSDDDLRIAFMRVWGHYSDPNFFKVAPKLGLPIEP